MTSTILPLIPYPEKISLGRGEFVINSETRIQVTPQIMNLGKMLAALLQPATGFPLSVGIESEKPENNTIILTHSDTHKSLNDEWYTLTVVPEHIIIQAHTEAGLFYGIQTLRQLLPPEIESKSLVGDVAWAIPVVAIQDQPRFKWRGLHLDVVRYSFSIEFIKKFIDMMALYKFNVFHWHLTDDQGWRIEIKQYPKLTEIGSKRKSSPLLTDQTQSDHTPYDGGFYTQDDIRDIVAYAKARFITVVPEIEMPGHAVAILACYPDLSCTGEEYEVWTQWGISEDALCAGNDDTFTFLKNVLMEVFELFPSEFIHIGGDECIKQHWQKCPKCQAVIEREGLADEDALQSYFIRRIEKFIDENRRRMVGWDEILEGGLAPHATVMSWRGSQGGIDAAMAGHDVVMSPNTHSYLNFHHEEDRHQEPVTLGRYVSLKKVYDFNPVENIPSDKQHHVLGGQGNIWTEFISTGERLEYLIHPRLSALSEKIWSFNSITDYEDFLRRLPAHLRRLDQLGVTYRNPFA